MPQDDLLRHAMVEGQLRPNKITCPRVLKAFETVSRRPFCLDERMSTSVYRDACIPLKPGRVWLSPLLMAHMLQWADIQPHERVCVLASGLGYMGALIQTYISDVSVQDEPENLCHDNGESPLHGVRVFAASVGQGPLEDVDVVMVDGGEIEQWPEALWKTKRTISLYKHRIICRETGATAPWDVWLPPDMDTLLPEFRARPKVDWLAPQ